MNIQFVNVAGYPGRQDAATRRKVKVHVMRRFRQEQRNAWRTPEPDSTVLPMPMYESPENRDSDHDTDMPPATGGTALEMTDTTSMLPAEWLPYSSDSSTVFEIPDRLATPFALDSNRLDPFDCLPIPGSPRIHTLLFQSTCRVQSCIGGPDQTTGNSTPIRTSVHADPTGLYRSSCQHDAGWLFMTLAHAANRFNNPHRGDGQESAYYHMKSVSAVNEALSVSLEGICDATIATVSCLTNIEVSLCSLTATAPWHAD